MDYNLDKSQKMMDILRTKNFDPLFQSRKALVDEVRAEGLMLANGGGSGGLIDPTNSCTMLDATQKIFVEGEEVQDQIQRFKPSLELAIIVSEMRKQFNLPVEDELRSLVSEQKTIDHPIDIDE